MNKEYKGYQNKGQYKRALKKSGPMLGIKESKPKKYKRPKNMKIINTGKGLMAQTGNPNLDTYWNKK